MKKLIFTCIILAFLFCCCSKTLQEQRKNVTPAVSSQENTVTPISTVTAVPSETPTPVPEQVDQETKLSSEPAEFHGVIISTSPNIIVRTNELNPPLREDILLNVTVFSTHLEREKCDFYIDNYYPVSELKEGDKVECSAYYCIQNGKRVIVEDLYNSIDVMESEVSYDFSKECRLDQVIEQEGGKFSDVNCMSYTCKADFLTKPFEASSINKKDFEEFAQLLQQYVVYEDSVTGNESPSDCNMVYCLTYDTAENKILLGFAPDHFYLYRYGEDQNAQIDKVYHYYRSTIPDTVQLLHLFLTADQLDLLAADYIAYDKKADNGSYFMHRGYTIDLNEDGEEEQLFISCCDSPMYHFAYDNSYYMKDESMGRLKIYINGKYEIVSDFWNIETGTFRITDLNVFDNAKEIVVRSEGPSDDPASIFYHHNGDSVVKIGYVPTYPYQLEQHRDGTNWICGSMRLNILQTWFSNASWRLNKQEQIELVKQELYVPTDHQTISLNTKINGYVQMSLNAERKEIEPQKLLILGTDNENWLKAQLLDDSIAWIYLEDGWSIRDEDFLSKEFNLDEYHQGMIMPFDDLCMTD